MDCTTIESIYNTLVTAYKAAIEGKSYTINLGGTSRSVTRNDLSVLRREMKQTQEELAQCQGTRRGINIRYGTP